MTELLNHFTKFFSECIDLIQSSDSQPGAILSHRGHLHLWMFWMSGMGMLLASGG